MINFEYKKIDFTLDENYQETLNELGKQQWEVIKLFIDQNQRKVHCTLKRAYETKELAPIKKSWWKLWGKSK